MPKRNRTRNSCHNCSITLPPRFMVPCQLLCGRHFCRKCLTKYYKYSRPKCSRLPSVNWKCPACAGKCICKNCATVSLKPCIEDKLVVKKAINLTHDRNGPSHTEKQDNDQYRLGVGTIRLMHGNDNQETSNPEAKQPLPPISSRPFDNSRRFHKCRTKKSR